MPVQGEEVDGRCSPSKMMTTGLSGSTGLTFRRFAHGKPWRDMQTRVYRDGSIMEL